ncbi:DUF1878 family protein [Virgibacillus ihumii]|uniref:DUF1878 family protein n=1 Tax=Virgibacillus ihumii TaxID=2686091 RepID=UPI001FECAB3F|nr:DUF1878 family protein [Virgibacillus ihumii]
MNLVSNETLSFQVQLLSKVIDVKQYPFIKLVVEKSITYGEYEQLMQQLADLNSRYEAQKEEGLLDFTPLLVHFAGMLNEKLDPNTTIFALKKEGYYPSLMNVFINILAGSGEPG